MKTCSICKEIKPFNEFNFLSNSRTKYRSGCKSCYAKDRRDKRNTQNSAEWYRRRLERVKLSAKKRKIKCNLNLSDIKDILSSDNCFYCEQTTSDKSVDRVDNNKGYSLNNCVMACWNCNYLKRTMTFKQIEMFYLKMRNRAV